MTQLARLVGVMMAIAPAAAAQPAPITFARDVAPIVFAKCAGCHHEGGDGPFPLSTFEDVRRRAATIRAVTERRYMPPWKPVPGFGDFHGERRLSDAELRTLHRWIDEGLRRGEDHDLPPAPRAAHGWPLGPPDVVLQLPSYALRADGADVFRNFVVPIPRGTPPYVRAWQFRPRTTAVHHANIRIDPTSASRALDDQDPAAGYEGVLLRSADFPDGHFLGWTPGQAPPRLSDAGAWRIEPGSDFVVQLHMRPTGKPETVAPEIGLYLGDTPPPSPPTMIRLGRQSLAIPAGAATHSVADSFTLPVAVSVRAVQAHAHYRATTVQAWAILPDGSRRELLRIDDWDPAWQDRYEYRAPVALPAGTNIAMLYAFDNSAGNPRNPVQPPQPAEWGWRTSDEMGDVWLQVTTRSDHDRERLHAAARTKMLNEDAIGTEALIAREPRRVDLRNDAAVIYMALARHADALRHFREVRRLQPSAAAAFNLGVALEAMRDLAAAEGAYTEAIRLDPNYSAAHNNLGAMLQRHGQTEAAHEAFALAVTTNPDNAEAHANLALTSIALFDPDAAEPHVLAAIRLRPDRASQYVQFVWLLTDGANSTGRRPAAACRIAEAIVTATARQDPVVLEARARACP